MAEADAEHRLLAENARDGSVRVRQRRRIAGTVGKKNPVGIVREDLLRGRRRGQHLDAKAGRDQPAQDVQLDSVVERDNQRRVAHRFTARAGYDSRCRDSNRRGPSRRARRQVTSFTRSRPTSPGDALALRTSRIGIEIDARNHRFLRAVRADVAHQRARVDSLDTDDARVFQIVAERHPPSASSTAAAKYSLTMKPST